MEIHIAAKTQRLIDVLETTEVSENGHVGIRTSAPKKAMESITQQKCIYTSAYLFILSHTCSWLPNFPLV